MENTLKKGLANFEGTKKSLAQGRTHSPESLFDLAQFFILIGDYRLACEVIWGGASLAIKNFISDRGLNVHLHSHTGKKDSYSRSHRKRSKTLGILKIAIPRFIPIKSSRRRR
ncbi:unnamed protein product, partial [Mesorhabditis belari]|uniref:Uncharacterized protein n=1 Tax=Mesorhabditis belari TaxID=2138241 RepID=A0AAF3FC67_9BILA